MALKIDVMLSLSVLQAAERARALERTGVTDVVAAVDAAS